MASAIGQLFYRSGASASTGANTSATGRSTTQPPVGSAQMPWPFPPRHEFTRTYDRQKTPEGRASRHNDYDDDDACMHDDDDGDGDGDGDDDDGDDDDGDDDDE